MRQTIIQLALIAAVVIAGFLALFKRDAVMSLFRSSYAAARGFAPAQTPTECVDRFRDAIRARDYDTAATYCMGDYAEQMKKGARGATALATEIDNYLSQCEKRDFNVEKVKWVMSYLEPFPPDFKYDLKQPSDDKAYVVIDPDNKLLIDKNAGAWQGTLDPRIMRALAKLPDQPVEIRLHTDGKEKSWKLNFEVTAPLRLAVDFLNSQYRDYVKALEKLKHEVVHDKMTRDEMEQHLKTELQSLRNQSK
jgi:hypothetical protein